MVDSVVEPNDELSCVFAHDGVKMAVDTTRQLIMSIRPAANNAFKLP